MSKRKSNVLSEGKGKSRHNSNSSDYIPENECESENEVIYSLANKNKRDTRSNVNLRLHGKVKKRKLSEEDMFPKENSEHSYSCFPLFTNISNNENSSDYSSDSADSSGKPISRRDFEKSRPTSENIKSNSGKGKSISWSENLRTRRKSKCNSKNAVMARMNRQRKKEYVSNLEGSIDSLKEINTQLKTKLNEQEDLVTSLKFEVKYLKSVISNSKEIGILLRRICGGNRELKVTSSLLDTSLSQSEETFSNVETEKDDNDLDWPLTSGFDTSEMDNIFQCDPLPTDIGLSDLESVNSFGVCLHVANKQVSLEFCATCSRSASNCSDINKTTV